MEAPIKATAQIAAFLNIVELLCFAFLVTENKEGKTPSFRETEDSSTDGLC